MNVEHAELRQMPERRKTALSDSHRLFISAGLASLGLLIPMLLWAVFELQDTSTPIMFAGMFAAGVVGRKWITVPIAIAAFAVTGMLFDLGYITILGAQAWEDANADHWGESGSVTFKVLGQSVEYLVFGVMFSMFVLIGILVGRYVERRRAGAATLLS